VDGRRPGYERPRRTSAQPTLMTASRKRARLSGRRPQGLRSAAARAHTAAARRPQQRPCVSPTRLVMHARRSRQRGPGYPHLPGPARRPTNGDDVVLLPFASSTNLSAARAASCSSLVAPSAHLKDYRTHGRLLQEALQRFCQKGSPSSLPRAEPCFPHAVTSVVNMSTRCSDLLIVDHLLPGTFVLFTCTSSG
jgi:hypothetical protein